MSTANALIGQLSLQLEDGTTVHASTDVELAQKWAEALHGPDAWGAMARRARYASTAEALAELRRAYAAARDEED
jgi:hypothetical protein